MSFELLNSGIKGFRLKDCRIGDSGLHAVVRSLARLPLQELALSACNLTDSSVPYLESILKVFALQNLNFVLILPAHQAHASFMDSAHWTSNLRNYKSSPHSCNQYESDYVYEAGLVALDISDNMFSDVGIASLSRVIRKNRWIIGAFWFNCESAK
jgi:hypothetical protein